MPAIAFLHTAHVHIATFDALVGKLAPGMAVHHEVDGSLLDDARAAGSVQPWLEKRIHKAMKRAAGGGATVVVCTCSTIGGAAETVETKGRYTAMRIDRPMAEAAVGYGPEVLVVAALESTLAPTVALLESTGKPLHATTHVVPGAWAQFEAGELDTYFNAIAEDIRARAEGFDAVILAQASMSPAAELIADLNTPVLSSPELGVKAALELR